MSGTEAVNDLFHFTVELVVRPGEGFDATQAAGAPAVLSFVDENQNVLRRVEGILSQAVEWLDHETVGRVYRVVVSPRAALLTLVTTQEVFLDSTIVEIIDEKLENVSLDHRWTRTITDYPKREIVVQYAENDLTFISRLCEHYGISFYFEPRAGDYDQLVFTDDQSFTAIGNPISLVTRGQPSDVYRLEMDTGMIPALYVCDDYNYRTPMVELRGIAETSDGIGGAAIEYGGHFKTPDEGKQLAEIRCQERACRRVVYRGECDRPDVQAGSVFTLTIPNYGDVELLVTSCEHAVAIAGRMSGRGGEAYKNVFTAVPTAVPYRPERRTPRARIFGIVSATVMPKPGSDGREPHIDGDGRYTVRLLFDMADSGEKASHVIRMAQPHAGPDYGIHFPLRPGVEVLLSFIDGDPDRPIIVGSVPNKITPSPVVASHNLFHRIKTASGVKVEIEDGY